MLQENRKGTSNSVWKRYVCQGLSRETFTEKMAFGMGLQRWVGLSKGTEDGKWSMGKEKHKRKFSEWKSAFFKI